MPIPVTLLYGALNAALTLILGVNVSRMRGAKKQFVGDAADAEVYRASRAHGNNAEWAPLGIVLLLLLELSHAPSLWLHLFGGTLLLARLAHAHGVLSKAFTATIGAGLNYLVIGAMTGYALFLRFH